MLYEPVKRLTGIHNIFQQALGASQKVFEYLDRDQQVKERPGAVKLARFEKVDRVRRRQLPLSQRAARDSCWMAIQLEVKAGRSGRAGGAERRGQDHAGESGAAILRRRPGARCASTAAMCATCAWPRCATRSASWRRIRSCSTIRWRTTSAMACRDATPEQIQRGRAQRAGRGIHSAHAGGLRHHDRRARPEAERRPAAAAGDRAGAAEERADPDPGRSHVASGHRIRECWCSARCRT